MNTFQKLASGILMSGLASVAMAEIKIIAHQGISDQNVSADVIADIYLGETSTLPSGAKAIPLDQSEDQAVRNDFYSKVAKKDSAQLKAHWSRLIFTGKGKPPRIVYDNEEAVAMVKSTPGAISYVSGNADTAGVKVLLVIR